MISNPFKLSLSFLSIASFLVVSPTSSCYSVLHSSCSAQSSSRLISTNPCCPQPTPFYPFLSFSSCTTQDCISGLLNKAVPDRLGCGANRAEDIQAHPWFQDIDWSALVQRQMEPPWKPDLKNDTDFK